MKNIFRSMAVVLCMSATISMAQSPVPYADTYETYSPGSNLIGTVWQGDATAFVTNVTYVYTNSVGRPVTVTTPTNVMAFSDGTITNEFNASGFTVVALDTMILPVFAEPPIGDQLVAASNSQMSLYISTNGFVTVFNGIQNNTLPANPNDGFEWTALTNTTPLTTGEWVRITVVMNYDSAINGPISMFKVAINGTFINSPNAYPTPNIDNTKGGPWFVSPKWADGDLQFHRVVLSGSGMLDDLVVTTNEIVFNPPVGPAYATNGTDIAWMQHQGLTTNVTYPTWDQLALADTDGDGIPNWSEYYAGTQPTNLASKLMIVSLTYSNGLPLLKWIGSSNALAPYAVQWSSNLMSILNWTPAATNLPNTQGTNEVTLPMPVSNPGFLRVNVNTNAP